MFLGRLPCPSACSACAQGWAPAPRVSGSARIGPGLRGRHVGEARALGLADCGRGWEKAQLPGTPGGPHLDPPFPAGVCVGRVDVGLELPGTHSGLVSGLILACRWQRWRGQALPLVLQPGSPRCAHTCTHAHMHTTHMHTLPGPPDTPLPRGDLVVCSHVWVRAGGVHQRGLWPCRASQERLRARVLLLSATGRG